MSKQDNGKKILIMSVGAIIGGLIGGVCGLLVLDPGMLIPIGVVIGLSVGLSLSTRKSNRVPVGDTDTDA